MPPKFPFLRSVAASLCSASLVFTPFISAAQTAPSRGTPTRSDKELVAVLDLEAANTDKFQAAALTDRFREELLKSGRFTLVDRAQMNKILEEQAFQQSGCTSSECAVQVGKLLGVRKIVAGRVTKIEETLWLISASMVDVETAETLRAESQQHEGNFRTLLSTGIGQLAAKVAAGGERKPDAAAMVAQLPPPAPAPVAKGEEVSAKGGGVKWYWWVIGGVAVAGAVAASSSSSSDKKKSSSSSSCSTCGSVGISW